MENITTTLAQFVAGLDHDQIPADVRARVKQLLLDITGGHNLAVDHGNLPGQKDKIAGPYRTR